MNVVIDDSLYEDLLKPCNITKDDVKEAVLNEYEKVLNQYGKETIESSGFDADIVFLKGMPNNYFLLVDAKLNPPNFSINNVFRIFPDTRPLQGIDIRNPIHVLQKIVDEFGYTLQIGDHHSKFIHNETIKVPKTNGTSKPPNQLANDLGHHLKIVDFRQGIGDKAITKGLVRYRSGGSDYDLLDVEMVYAISLKKYLEYQHENDSTTGEASFFRD